MGEFVCVSVCQTKQVERSTDRSLPPMFTKLSTKVESKRLITYFKNGKNPKYFCPLK